MRKLKLHSEKSFVANPSKRTGSTDRLFLEEKETFHKKEEDEIRKVLNIGEYPGLNLMIRLL